MVQGEAVFEGLTRDLCYIRHWHKYVLPANEC